MEASNAGISVTEAPAGKHSRLLPFDDPSRRRRIVKVVAWLIGVAVVVLVLQLLGVDVRGWLSSVWDALKNISFWYLLAGWAVQTVQTTLTALAWFFILRAGFPRAPLSADLYAHQRRDQEMSTERIKAGLDEILRCLA